ncbi:protein serine/threonine phosphatase 2C [Rickenella mellea]|uniref:Protein serine/threonine phosphatase 2C n=1 Tax=Rickenella mellea TaxID=50990 RepID=A0A4Y7Q4U6_9AGAM|nr:protein serine/threonine phosphatase 2C [Rickenella mellea]
MTEFNNRLFGLGYKSESFCGWWMGTSGQDRAYYAVYSGCGGKDEGERAQIECHRQFFHSLLKHADYGESPMTDEILNEIFKAADEKYPDRLDTRNKEKSAASAAFTCLQREKICGLDRWVLYVGNVGDCRVVLCTNGKARQLSQDHTLGEENSSDIERILKEGGIIKKFRHASERDAIYVKDRWSDLRYAGPLTRAVGRHNAKDDEFFIIASREVWLVMSNQEAVDFAQKFELETHSGCHKAASELVEYVLQLSGATADAVSPTIVIVPLTVYSRVAPANANETTVDPNLRPLRSSLDLSSIPGSYYLLEETV